MRLFGLVFLSLVGAGACQCKNGQTCTLRSGYVLDGTSVVGGCRPHPETDDTGPAAIQLRCTATGAYELAIWHDSLTNQPKCDSSVTPTFVITPTQYALQATVTVTTQAVQAARAVRCPPGHGYSRLYTVQHRASNFNM